MKGPLFLKFDVGIQMIIISLLYNIYFVFFTARYGHWESSCAENVTDQISIRFEN